MKIRYVGESFGTFGLTNGKVYDAIDLGAQFYWVLDDGGDFYYLYSKHRPAPSDGSSKGGKWEVVELDHLWDPAIQLEPGEEVFLKDGRPAIITTVFSETCFLANTRTTYYYDREEKWEIQPLTQAEIWQVPRLQREASDLKLRENDIVLLKDGREACIWQDFNGTAFIAGTGSREGDRKYGAFCEESNGQYNGDYFLLSLDEVQEKIGRFKRS